MTRVAARLLGLAVGAVAGIALVALWGALRHEPRGAVVADLFIDQCFGRITGDPPRSDGASFELVNGPDGIAIWDARSGMLLELEPGDCPVSDVFAYLNEEERSDAFERVRRAFVVLVPGTAMDRIEMPSSFDPFLVVSRPVAPNGTRPVPAVMLLRMVAGDAADPATGSTVIRLVTDPDADLRWRLGDRRIAPNAAWSRNGGEPALLSLGTEWRPT